jgi:hypothetical protein
VRTICWFSDELVARLQRDKDELGMNKEARRG